MARIRFGPAGKPIDFKGDVVGIPAYLKSMGLDAFEYQAVRGVKISEEKAKRLGEEARNNDVLLSLHAPYYINFSSTSRETIEKSVNHLVNAGRAAKWMGAYIVVFHPGYYGDSIPAEALRRAIEAVKRVREILDQEGARDVWLGPETMGKRSQLGTVDEIIELCSKVERTKPVVDWAHIHARSRGADVADKDYVVKLVDRIERELGSEAVKPLHMHFTRVEYSDRGEVRHHELSKTDYGPEFKHVIEGLLEVGVDGVIICESPLLDKDAVVMKKMYEELRSARKA